jgi:hypothetical protein
MTRTPADADIAEFTPSEVVEKNLAEMRPMVDANDIAQAIVRDKFDVIKALGRIEAASFFTTVGDKLIAETALQIREGKKYKGLPYTDADGNLRHVGDFPEFCRNFMGKSYSRVMELISNYNSLGSDLYEKAELLGFRQRDYNALKALPVDDRQLIALAIEEENLDKALDLMQEMAAKHLREKEAAQKQQEELKAALDTKDLVIAKKDQKINQLDTQQAELEIKKRLMALAPPEDLALEARNAVQRTAEQIKASIMTTLRGVLKHLIEDAPGQHKEFASACLIEIGRELAILRGDFNLPDTVSESLTPEWLTQDDLDAIQGQVD